MSKGFKCGSSGVNPLNFQVKTYPSETELKADKPNKNTVGIITTTTMNKWAFTTTEPANPDVGMVWISIGNTSAAEFNALTKNAIQVYPISAKQYVGGKWEDVTAMSYLDGMWAEWADPITVYYVFQNGSFKTGSFNGNGNGEETGAAVTNGNISLYVEAARSVMFWWSEHFDVSNYSKLIFVVPSMTNFYGNVNAVFTCGVGLNAEDDSFVAQERVTVTSTSTQAEYSVDISSLSGKHYVKAKLARTDPSDQDEVLISEIRFEP